MKKLIKSKLLLGGTLLALAATTALAEDASTGIISDCYKAGEISIDGFATGSLGKYTIEHLSGSRVNDNTRLGAGLGVNYFFTRYLGLGGEVYSENTTGSWVDSGSANVILRLPLGQSGFAPYALGGGGYHFDTIHTWFAQAGGGLEYRFCQHLGVFIDAVGVLPEETQFYGVARLGMRFTF